MNGPDVRWDGVPHQKIVEWVSAGPGAALTEQMNARLKSAADALSYTSNLVNAAIQRASGDWQGSAADTATEAMRVLRNFDDGMHFTSTIASIRAFGQSDGAGFVRANVPPVVAVKPPNPTGGLIDIISSTVDYQHQQAAARQAEQRAREVMQQYTEATRERVAAMPPLRPAPQVVLDITPPPPPPTPPPRPPIVEPPRSREPGGGPREGGPVQAPDDEAGPGQPGPAQPNPASSSATPGPTQAAVAPGQGSAPIAPGAPNGLVLEDRGSGATAPPPAGGFIKGEAGERLGSRPLSETPGRGGGAPGGGHYSTGGRGGNSAGRGAALARGMPAGVGGGTPFGVGPGARRDEDQEHQVKYGVPTAEHFEPDDSRRDPHREGWSVAPEVIGDRDDEEGDQR